MSNVSRSSASGAVAASAPAAPPEPKGVLLAVIIAVLAMGNFLAILDMTIANVLVSHIAGGLAASSSNGTWVVTGYAVAEAIMVPITGWLSERFGPVRVFVLSIIGFGVMSLLCGLATSMGMLIAFRIIQGICGGPIMPISQALLVRIVPHRFSKVGLTIWTMGTVLAPVAGPVLGGIIGDNWGWQWAFFFKVPLAPLLAFVAWKVLSAYEAPRLKLPVDVVGLGLLIAWVGALQIMLGNGQDLDWFNSDFIVTLAIVSAIGFVAFIIWELTEKNPIVNLRVYRSRAFTVSMVVVLLAFGVVFGSIVLVPLWLQSAMGYTATWAGYNSAIPGLSSVIAAPVTAILISKYDRRLAVMIGLLFCAASCLLRVSYNEHMTFLQLAYPQLLIGLGQVMVMLTLTDMSIVALKPEDATSGAVQFNFVRTLASAFATAIVVAIWNHQMSASKAALVGALHNPYGFLTSMQASGMPADKALHSFDGMVMGQAVMQATNITFLILGGLMLATAAFVWVAPKIKKPDNTGQTA